MSPVLSVNLECFLITAQLTYTLKNSVCHQFDKNRLGDLVEHVTAMTEVRSAFRRVQGKTEDKKSRA